MLPASISALSVMSAHEMALVFSGTWILCFRILIRTRCRLAVQIFTAAVCGSSFALLSPLMPWPPPIYRVPIMALIGGLMSVLHVMLMAFIIAISLGMAFGALIWHLGVCTFVSSFGPAGPFLHPLLLFVSTITSISVFVCSPVGPNLLERVLLPVLGALLLIVGLSGLESAQLPGLDPATLFAPEPCASSVHPARAPFVFMLSWLGASLVGIVLVVLFRLCGSSSKEGSQDGEGSEKKKSMVASLLGSQDDEDGLLPRPTEADTGRHGTITAAIYAPEGTDLSHLTENERKLVEVCRKDEFERDRVLWGGGLI
eukprot:gnl/TRDRNA2_/TRDRNA2_160870_c0_seq2.p1 gnl/TRDRNA2_/TRDRNA2_160870_c0~~gnl/TRDRNA2_/TRDRNA2_160870_c0_seq2.p1  ORF type:complete len:314 (+),score=37.91 gnl/TRDRNA2_/TRDRNA2_160870_c0_seq2:68-1009(+)